MLNSKRTVDWADIFRSLKANVMDCKQLQTQTREQGRAEGRSRYRLHPFPGDGGTCGARSPVPQHYMWNSGPTGQSGFQHHWAFVNSPPTG